MAIFIPLVTKFDSKGLDGAKRALANFQNFAVDVGRIAATAITAVGVASVREAAQFETSIAKVEGLVGVAGAELEQMAEAARRLGTETGKGAQEAADALFVIASSGLRGSDAIEALELSLKASTAGLGDTESIARSVSGALNAYGTEVISAAEATDVIVATARAGNFETSQFASAIGRVLPFAKQAGSSLEDMGGAVALLTRTNTDAAQSVTQVSALFRAFVVPTEEAKKALDNVGLSAEDMRNAIASEGLPAALDMLDEKLGGNREQLGRLLGSSEAASAAFQILDADAQTIAETFGVVNDATGITQEAFEVMQDTTENKFAVAMATAKDSLISIGDAILENLEPHLNTFIEWMQENGPAIEEGFIEIFDAMNTIITSEVLADIVAQLQDMWPEVEQLGIEFGILMEELKPLTDLIIPALNALLVFTKDTVSDLGDSMNEFNTQLNIFDEEAPTTMKRIEEQGNGWARFINPRVWDAVSGLREYIRLQSQISSSAGITGPHSDPLSMTGLGRAKGGPVLGGQGYLVGEMGPELFIPNQGGGTIIPNNRMGGSNINITVNAGLGANGSAIGQEIVSLIKRFERTSGPVFASA